MGAKRGRRTSGGGAAMRPRLKDPRYFTNGFTKNRISEISRT